MANKLWIWKQSHLCSPFDVFIYFVLLFLLSSAKSLFSIEFHDLVTIVYTIDHLV